MLFGHRFRPIFVLSLSRRLSLVILCSCKTVHHAVHIEPRHLRMIFETLFMILQWKRRLAAQQSLNRMGTNSAHFSWTLVKTTDNLVSFFAFLGVTLLCSVSRLKYKIMASGINIYSELLTSRFRILDIKNTLLISGIHLLMWTIGIINIKNSNFWYQQLEYSTDINNYMLILRIWILDINVWHCWYQEIQLLQYWYQ